MSEVCDGTPYRVTFVIAESITRIPQLVDM